MTEFDPPKHGERRDWISNALLLMGLAALVYYLFFHVSESGRLDLGPARSDPRPIPPHPAPEFTVKDPEGGVHRLSETRGEALVLVFWAPWCGACKTELPDLDRLAGALKGRARVWLVATDYTQAAEVLTIAKSKGIAEAQVLFDDRRKGSDLYGVRVLPTALIIDRFGVVRYRLGGTRSWTARSTIEEIETIVNLPEGGRAE